MLRKSLWVVRERYKFDNTSMWVVWGKYLFEGVCGRATNVILAPSTGCKGFARPSVTSVPARKLAQTRAKSRKLSEFQDQAYP